MPAPLIGRRPRWAPPPTALPDPSHPLSAGLVFCHVTGVELASGRGRATGAGAPDTPTVFGNALNGRASWPNAATADLAFTSGAWTVAGCGWSKITSGTVDILARYTYTSEANNQGWSLDWNGAGLCRFIVFNNNAAATYLLSTTPSPNLGPFVAVGVSDPNATQKRSLYYNGALAASATTTPNPVVDNVASLTSGPLSTVIQARTTSACAWNRALSPNEVAQYTADPFCFLRW